MALLHDVSRLIQLFIHVTHSGENTDSFLTGKPKEGRNW